MNTALFGEKCVGIARVSTYIQDTKAQAETLENMAKQLGLTLEKTFETKESGFISLDKKDGFGLLQDYLKNNRVKIVLVTELSRLARRKIILEQIKQWFLDNKIQLYVINISFSLFDDFGNVSSASDIVFSVFASMAESEMKEKKVRFKQAHRDLNQQGLSIVGKTLFGYTRVRMAVKVNGKLRSKMEVNEDQAKQIRQIYEWYLNGINGDPTQCSVSKIRDECVALGFDRYLHSKRNVNKALKCVFYTGDLIETQYPQKSPEFWTYKDTTAPKYVLSEPGTVRYPQIITKELFDAVQQKMKEATTIIAKGKGGIYTDISRKHFGLLSKLIKCQCGLYMAGDIKYGKGHTGKKVLIRNYRCTNHKSHGVNSIPMRPLDFAVYSICRQNHSKYLEHLKSFPFISSLTEISKRIENLQQEKMRVESQKKDLADRFLKIRHYAPSESTFLSEMEALEKDEKRLEQLILKENKRLTDLQQSQIEIVEYVDHLKTIEGNKDNMRKFIQRMVDVIIPRYRDRYLIVTEIVMHSPSLAVKTTEPDAAANELSEHIYVIFNMRATINPEIRYIIGPSFFDPGTGLFYLPDSMTSTVSGVFDDEDEVYFRSLRYHPLTIYDDDYPGSQKDIG